MLVHCVTVGVVPAGGVKLELPEPLEYHGVTDKNSEDEELKATLIEGVKKLLTTGATPLPASGDAITHILFDEGEVFSWQIFAVVGGGDGIDIVQQNGGGEGGNKIK